MIIYSKCFVIDISKYDSSLRELFSLFSSGEYPCILNTDEFKRSYESMQKDIDDDPNMIDCYEDSIDFYHDMNELITNAKDTYIILDDRPNEEQI